MIYKTHYASPLGGITLACDGDALAGLWFDGQKYYPALPDCKHEESEFPVFAEAKRWLDIYFDGVKPEFTPEIRLHASDFR